MNENEFLLLKSETEVQEAINRKVDLYAERYQSGKDMWTGNCLFCQKEDCDCNINFERLEV